MVNSGEERYEIAHGAHRATVSQVGAAVRDYRVGDRHVFQPYDLAEMPQGFQGAVLVPWPNRIADGRYEFDGQPYQLAINEPERATALHGLAVDAAWKLVERTADRVVLELGIEPSSGYPFSLDTVVEYTIGADGLRVVTTSTNTGDHACPYGLGFHPYSAIAPGTTVDDCTLQLDVRRHLICDDRLIPIGVEAVDGTGYDFREPRSLAGVQLDDAFAGAIADADGISHARLRSADGATVVLWADAGFDYWQVYTSDRLDPDLARRSVAIEPMTAAPNAFQTGDGLIRLEPGSSFTGSWGATLR